MILKQLTIEATHLSDRLWLARLDLEKAITQVIDHAELVELIQKYLRLNTLEEKALRRMARRLAKQVDAG